MGSDGRAQLSIANMGNETVIFWPASIKGYVLESATNLSNPNWVPAGDAVPVTAVTVLNSSAVRLFRLVAAPPSGMAFIPGGQFTMGDTLDGETNAVPLTVTVSPFYMDTNLVSYSQWQSVYAWATNTGYQFTQPGWGYDKEASSPVYDLTWFDAVKWCNARSQLAGLKPAYYTDVDLTQLYTGGQLAPFVNWTASGYRLPTEAEWERAARGGAIGQRFPWGNVINENLANYWGDTNLSYDLGPNGPNPVYGGYPSPVGHFPANAYGLCDMAGNISAWCWDWLGTPYAGGTDPHGPLTGTYRVLRGGDCTYNAYLARCACRSGYIPTYTLGPGFRCVLGL